MCTCVLITITKITTNSCSKFSCVRPFYVIFVIVMGPFFWKMGQGGIVDQQTKEQRKRREGMVKNSLIDRVTL